MSKTDMNTTFAGVLGAAMLLWTQVQPLLHMDWRHVNALLVVGAVVSAYAGYKAKDAK